MATNKAYKPGIYNTGVVRGDFFSETFVMVVDDVPLDLSAAAIRSQFRDSSSGDLIREFSTSAGDIVIDTSGDANAFTWSIEADVTRDFATGAFVYDVEITIGGRPRTYIKGMFTVLQDTTI